MEVASVQRVMVVAQSAVVAQKDLFTLNKNAAPVMVKVYVPTVKGQAMWIVE